MDRIYISISGQTKTDLGCFKRTRILPALPCRWQADSQKGKNRKVGTIHPDRNGREQRNPTRVRWSQANEVDAGQQVIRRLCGSACGCRDFDRPSGVRRDST